MLRIGDIHIQAKRADRILEELHSYIDTFPKEQHIVFLGDYVYHFQYDRKSLLQLFHFFLGLYTSGKHVYILAGNHDWIHNHFVYEEAQHAFAVSGQDAGSIQFFTTPSVVTIEGQDCLFFPYTPFLEEDDTIVYTKKFDALKNSEHIGEQLSAKANRILQSSIDSRRSSTQSTLPLCVFHHRYIAQTTFPGQKTTFAYKNHALSPHFADISDVILVSGHIHHPFVWENYVCIGSVRSTSPLEANHMKYCFQWSVDSQKLRATPIEVNPYLRIDAGDVSMVDHDFISNFRNEIFVDSCRYMSSGNISCICDELSSHLPLSSTSISLEHDTLSYDDIHQVITPELLQATAQCVLKRQKNRHTVDTNSLDIASKNLDSSISGWKELLKEYIHKKWGKDAELYIDTLEELQIV